ncbi:MAG: 3-hydroxyacyl-ACP dehydratase FabZ family protein [Planctomycetia bacterium]|nr:3-hydroxyacyl-ACP dehydratase FabZ family protein [Planctomycetia bacterium]
MQKPFIVDSSLYDLDRPVANIEDIRKYNSQRYEMELLTGILYEAPDGQSCVGFRDTTENEFWVRGHMPGYPLMPGVVMCETAAQLASYFVGKRNFFDHAVMGFAGLEEVKFRGMVRPGDRFVVQCSLIKVRKLLITAAFMGIVNESVVCEGIIKGFPLPSEVKKIS